MTQSIGIGVIGMGWLGEVHSRSYREIPDRFHDSGIRPRLVVCSDNVAGSKDTLSTVGGQPSVVDSRGR
jgi:hypothetical protein